MIVLHGYAIVNQLSLDAEIKTFSMKTNKKLAKTLFAVFILLMSFSRCYAFFVTYKIPSKTANEY